MLTLEHLRSVHIPPQTSALAFTLEDPGHWWMFEAAVLAGTALGAGSGYGNAEVGATAPPGGTDYPEGCISNPVAI